MKKILLTGGGTAGHVTPNIALIPSLKELNYDIKVFCTPTLNGQVWLMGSPIWLRNYQDIDRVIEDFENSKFRVLEIRKQLGWDKKDSFFKGLFDGL